MGHVEFDRRATRDLRRLTAKDQDRIEDGLKTTLGASKPPANADVKAIAGAAPWLRLRIGNLRVLYRPLAREELKALGVTAKRGYLVARVVHRRDLDRAAATLD